MFVPAFQPPPRVELGRALQLQAGVGSPFNSVRVIFPLHETSVLVSDIRFSFQN